MSAVRQVGHTTQALLFRHQVGTWLSERHHAESRHHTGKGRRPGLYSHRASSWPGLAPRTDCVVAAIPCAEVAMRVLSGELSPHHASPLG